MFRQVGKRFNQVKSMKLPSVVRNRREGVAVLFAVALTALLATGALAIDLGMLFTARAEAQRVADATALAAASSFKDFFADSAQAVDTAQARGLLYATENTIRGTKVDAANVAIQVDFNAFTATAFVRSPSLGTWMARTFGITSAIVQAKATAWFGPLGGVKCVKPFAIPDLWDETNHDPPPSQGYGQDVDSDQRWDIDEGWHFEPPADTYEQWDPLNANSTTATGYGSNWRNAIGSAQPNDIGLLITVKAQQPGGNIGPGFFYPWRIDDSQGANDYKDNITTCNPLGGKTGVAYRIEAGNMPQSTTQAVAELVALDPGASWDQSSKSVISPNFAANWQQSPRVFIAGLFDPSQIAIIEGGPAGSTQYITFNNFGLFFLEGTDPDWTGPPPLAPVLARFIGFAQGSNESTGPAGPLSRRLRLIE